MTPEGKFTHYQLETFQCNAIIAFIESLVADNKEADRLTAYWKGQFGISNIHAKQVEAERDEARKELSFQKQALENVLAIETTRADHTGAAYLVISQMYEMAQDRAEQQAAIVAAAQKLGAEIQDTINQCEKPENIAKGRTPSVVCVARDDYNPFLAALGAKA